MARWLRVLEFLVVVILLFFAIPIQVPSPQEKAFKELFHSYMKKFNKTYSVDSPEYYQRFEAFKNAHSSIELYNSQRPHNDTAVYGYTQFSDLTENEFTDNHLSKPVEHKHSKTKPKHHHVKFKKEDKRKKHDSSEENRIRRQINIGNLPLKVDWREKGIISAVRNQGLCGSCWAYSTIHTVEAMYAKNHNLTNLSVQQAIDCASNGNYGCMGGDICALLQWLVNSNITVETELKYPTSKSGRCLMKKGGSEIGARVKKYSCYSLVNLEDEILFWLANYGPVAVGINALSWQNYLGGVIQYHCSGSDTSLNHAVQIVGYDTTAEIPYYIAKNSWGTKFGNQGYVHLAIGENICGLANEVSMIEVY